MECRIPTKAQPLIKMNQVEELTKEHYDEHAVAFRAGAQESEVRVVDERDYGRG
jgi:hypothetical protein